MLIRPFFIQPETKRIEFFLAVRFKVQKLVRDTHCENMYKVQERKPNVEHSLEIKSLLVEQYFEY